MITINFKHNLPLYLTDEKEGKKYIVKYATPSGGKAGKGNNKTSTIQVMDQSPYRLIKQIRYSVRDKESEKNAIEKAIQHCVGYREAKKYFQFIQ